MPEYLILRGVNDNGWIEEKKITAHGARAAIRAYLDGQQTEGTWVAVPTRSWRPEPITVETKTQLRFQ